MTIPNYDYEIEKRYHPENFQGNEEVCEECEKREKRLNKMGYSTSVRNSMVSSFKNIILCHFCGKEMEKHDKN